MIKYPGRQGWLIAWKYDIWCESCLSKPTTVYHSHWLQLKTFQAPKNRLPEGPFKEENLQGDWRRKSGVEKQKMYKWISSLFSLTSHDHVNLGNRAAGVQSKDWEKPFIMVGGQRKVNPVSQKVGGRWNPFSFSSFSSVLPWGLAPVSKLYCRSGGNAWGFKTLREKLSLWREKLGKAFPFLQRAQRKSHYFKIFCLTALRWEIISVIWREVSLVQNCLTSRETKTGRELHLSSQSARKY